MRAIHVAALSCLAAFAFAVQPLSAAEGVRTKDDIAFAAPAATDSGGALSLKTCSVKYQQAKADGALGGQDWNAFRRAACGWGAGRPTAQATASAEARVTPQADRAASGQVAKVAFVSIPEGVTFPSALSQAYASQRPAQQRMRTCLEGYHANKSAGTLHGIRWIQQGGGYYSACNKKLKASS